MASGPKPAPTAPFLKENGKWSYYVYPDGTAKEGGQFVDEQTAMQSLDVYKRQVLNVGALEDGVRADGVAHGGDVASDGAVAHGHEDARVSADFFDLRFVIDRGNSALDESDVDIVGIDFCVDDGAVNEVDQLSNCLLYTSRCV